MQHTDSWLPLIKQFNPLWVELDARIAKFEKLLKRLPLAETRKLKLIQETAKEKSGYFACAVNNNIDLLLLAEFFETKKSRNILLGRETERFQKIFGCYSMYSKSGLKDVYSSFDINENAPQAISSFDLFSAVTPLKTDNALPLDISLKLEDIENFISAQSNMSFMLKGHIIAWEIYNIKSGFENNREALHYINFCIDAMDIKCYKLLNFEKGVTTLSNEKCGMKQWLEEFIKIWDQELTEKTAFLKELFRLDTGFHNFVPMQKTVSNYLFDTGFDTPLHNLKVNETEQKLLRVALKNGTLMHTDIAKLFNLGKQSEEAREFLESGYLIPVINAEGEQVWVIRAGNTEPHRLKKFERMPVNSLKAVPFVVNDYESTEGFAAVNEQATILPVKEVKTRKAFFG
ncbi:MAG: hypothetical protein H7321_00130 [Bacteroidia bacterium]|nr:hypothetical protein [Bacteroidia bacterium]